MNEIKKYILKKELLYDNKVILKYLIEYPQIVNSPYLYGKEKFNFYNKYQAVQLQNYIKNELFKEAKELYEYNVQNGYPIMVYDIVKKYEITYNTENIISLYFDDYRFTGGAHGNTIRTSQNWDLIEGKEIPLKLFYPKNPNYVQKILQEVNKQIKEQIQVDEKMYFDNYCELVVETFNVENYFLYSEYMEVFFQQYDIAPYVSGIPTFIIKK